MVSGQLHITSDTLTPGLKKFPMDVDIKLTQIMDYFAPRAEAFMRSNAPWTDRTGNARSGLRATPQHVPQVSHRIELSHGVPYGIWLETRFSGKYAIIEPTIQSQGRELMALMKDVL